MCVDTQHKQKDEKFGLKECIKDTSGNGEQNFTLTWHKDIRPKGRTVCWDVSDPNDKAEIALYPCHGMKGNQYWRYDVVRIKILVKQFLLRRSLRKNNGLFTVAIQDV